MKKIVNFSVVVFSICLVLVPLVLLSGGLYLGTGPVWDVMMLAGMLLILAVAYNKVCRVQKGKECAEQARFMVGMIGMLASFLPLAAQAIFCRVNAPAILVCEGAIVWLFLLVTIGIIDALRNEKPDNKLLKWSVILATCWIALCSFVGMLDIYEYFSGQEIPERLIGILSVMVPTTAIAAFVCGFFGVLINSRR